MAFLLTPRLAPAYQAPQCNPFGFCAPVSGTTYTCRSSRSQPRRPQYSSFNHFFSQVNELLGEIDREAQRQAHIEAHLEAQREAHRQRQQRKRALRAKFTVTQIEQGWQVGGDIQGFEQENISIEVTDEHTLKISGNTQWKSEKTQDVNSVSAPVPDRPSHEAQSTEAAQNDNMDRITSNVPEAERTTETDTVTIDATTLGSDTESHKSYQATVEDDLDDFEDLGAETSSLLSASSGTSTPAATQEFKGKGKVVERPVAAETAVASLPQLESSIQQPQQEQDFHEKQERLHGSFERTFRFPERIQVDNVSASFRDGVFRVTVPKAQAPQIRRVVFL